MDFISRISTVFPASLNYRFIRLSNNLSNGSTGERIKMTFWISSLLFVVGVVVAVPGAIGVEVCVDGVVIDLIAYQANSTYLETPNFPNGYTHNFWCGVRIFAENGVDTIKMRARNSSIDKADDSTSCTLDFAEIYDGHDPSFTKLVRWCGDDTPSVNSTGPYAFFYFQSDATVTDEGLQLEFSSGVLPDLPVTEPIAIVVTDTTSAGGIAGGVIGGLVGLAALIFGSVKLYSHCKNKSKVSVQKISLKSKDKSKGADVEKTAIAPTEKTPLEKTESRPQSRFGPQSGRNSRLMTANSFNETTGTLTPAFSPTPPRTPKGSVRFLESRLSRLNAGLESPATPPPSHREILRSSTITIASVNSKNKLIDDLNSETPVILEDADSPTN